MLGDGDLGEDWGGQNTLAVITTSTVAQNMMHALHLLKPEFKPHGLLLFKSEWNDEKIDT